MVFTKEDKVLVKVLQQEKSYRARKFIKVSKQKLQLCHV